MKLNSNITPLSLLVALSHLRMIDFFAVIIFYSFLFFFLICTSLGAISWLFHFQGLLSNVDRFARFIILYRITIMIFKNDAAWFTNFKKENLFVRGRSRLLNFESMQFCMSVMNRINAGRQFVSSYKNIICSTCY